jgi:hypothetical protein
MPLTQAIKQHLLLDGESLTINAYKALTDQDRADLIAGFEAMGIQIIPQPLVH